MSVTASSILESIKSFGEDLFKEGTKAEGSIIAAEAGPKDVSAGIIKGNTADLLGAPIDIANTVINIFKDFPNGYGATPAVKIPGGSDTFRSMMGMNVEDKNAAETTGSMVSLGGAAKAMIVGAARLGKVNKVIDVNKAIELSTKGTNIGDIFSKTGAYEDVGGRLKSVISDAGAKLDSKNLIAGESSKLDQVLDHPELYNIYPELRQTTVAIKDMAKGVGGSFDKNTNNISLNSTTPTNRMRDILLHEVQHNIQKIEGFQSGGNPKSFKLDAPPIADIMQAVESSGKVNTVDLPSTVINIRSQFANETNNLAQVKYRNLPGEQEARFTQATRNMSEQDIASNVLNMLRNGVTPANGYTEAIPKVLSLQERINLIPK